MLPLLLALQVATGPSAADTAVHRGDRGQLEVRAPRVESPEIRIDGRLDEAEWSGAAVLGGFTRFEPVEGVPAAQPTEVLVLYSGDAIYFGIRAYDSEPDRIRASLTERDSGVFEDDWVRITLDTFRDNRQAYAFYVNPLGIQADGLWIEGGEGSGGGGFGPPIDFNPDFIWESAGRVTEDGWVAELRIPYISLRFRQAARQTWGLNVARELQRVEWSSSWAPLTQDAANWLSLSGSLVDLEDLRPRRLVELNPVATGKRVGELREGEFVRDDFEPEFGVNARLGVAQNLVLDATVNPDFSQVEADEDQVAVNERFALFFAEKRPFFLEGTEVFATPQQLVYTRSIVDPIAGAKLTGKAGAFNVGYLGALDESPVTFDEGDDEALFNLVRVRRDVGVGSTVGALYTDRTLLGGSAFNRVGALDTRLLIAGRYTLTAQLAGAWTRDDVDDAGPSPAGTRFGPLWSAEVERSGVHFSWNAGIEDVHPDFSARSGFIRRVGDTEVEAEVQYTFYPAGGGILEDWSPELSVQAFFDHDDFWAGRKYHEAQIEAALDFSLRGPNGGQFQVSNGYFAFDPTDYAGYEAPAAGPGGTQYVPFTAPDPLTGLWSVGGFGRARPLPWLSFDGHVFYNRVPIFAEAGRGTELSLESEAAIRFPWGLRTELSFTYSRIHRRSDDSRFSVAQIPRLKVQYQLSRALFVRGILQYNLEERDALRSAAGLPLRIGGSPSEPVDRGEAQYDLLVAYEPSPGTVVYAGWTRIREGPNTYRFGDLTSVGEGLFIKLSYLLRL